MLACLAAALASVALQGFRFGVSNNLFHIPIVLRWYDLPRFADDAFIQSLRRFATPVFPFLSLFTDGATIAPVFAAAHLLARTLAFYAVLQMVRACGLAAPRDWIAVGAVALCATLYGASPVGKDDLLPDYFTHTELAQALVLLGMAWLIDGRPLRAGLMLGAGFDLNAVVGVWALAPAALVLLFGRPRAWPPRSRAGLSAAAAFALVALPEALWLVHDQRSGSPRFDYRAFLIDYYPYHFFIGWAKWGDRLVLVQQILCGGLAAGLLPRGGRRAALALLGFVLVFAAGMVIDQYARSRLILDLHLLRVDGMVLWIAVPLVAAAAGSTLLDEGPISMASALVILAGLTLGVWPLAGLGLLALVGERVVVRRAPASATPAPFRRAPAWAGVAGAALVGAGAAFLIGLRAHSPAQVPPGAPPRDEQLIGAWPRASDWRRLTDWARASTPPDAVFLVPQRLDFVQAAERRSWVGWKEGAAAMWAPETYPSWKRRSDEVKRLLGPASVLAYACAHRIDYVVFDKRHQAAAPFAGSPTRDVAFADRWFSVVKVVGCPPGQGGSDAEEADPAPPHRVPAALSSLARP